MTRRRERLTAPQPKNTLPALSRSDWDVLQQESSHLNLNARSNLKGMEKHSNAAWTLVSMGEDMALYAFL